MYLTGKICNIAQKLRCESVAKSALRFCHCPSNRKISATAEEAEKFLSGLCADPDNSCVCENVVSLTPKYDLQIVVPVYNTARYIEECVDSVLNQSTHYSYKIILVNDGIPAKPLKFKWTIDEILEHEAALYPEDQRFTRAQLEKIFEETKLKGK